MDGAGNSAAPEMDVKAPLRDPGPDGRKPRSWHGRLGDKLGLRPRQVLWLIGLLTLLLLVFLVIIGLACAWPRTPHSLTQLVCATPGCLATAQQIVPIGNLSYSPCTAPWQWACGAFLRKSPPQDESRWSLAKKRRRQADLAVVSLLSRLPAVTSFKDPRWKALSLFDSCLEPSSDDELKSDLKKRIDQLGGWNVMGHFETVAWDYRSAIEKLQSRYGGEVFFTISVVAHDVDGPIIRLSPAGLGLPDPILYTNVTSFSNTGGKRRILAYQRLLAETAQSLGAQSAVAQRFADRLIHFEARLAKVWPNMSTTEYQDDFDDNEMSPKWPRQTYFSGEKSTLGEVRKQAPSLPIMEVLANQLPSRALGDETPILLYPKGTMSYLSNASVIVASTDSIVLNDLVQWQLVRTFLPLLPKESTEPLIAFEADVLGLDQTPPRWKVCAENLRSTLPVAVAALEQAQISPDQIKDVRMSLSTLMDSLRDTITRRRFSNSNQNDSLQIKELQSRLSNLTLHVGMADSWLENDFASIASLYNELPIYKRNLFNNQYNSIEYVNIRAARALSVPGAAAEDQLLSALSNIHIIYEPANHAIVIPWRTIASAASEYNSLPTEWPPCKLYAELGVPIARALLQSLKQQDMDSESEALLITAAALNSHLETTPHLHLPGLETLDEPELFYLIYGQKLCQTKTEARKSLDQSTGREDPEKRFLYLLQKDPYFKEYFSCS